jgi:hypothetical protein
MKMEIKREGESRFYVSIAETVPRYWSQFEIDSIWVDNRGKEWLEISYYTTKPFSTTRKFEAYVKAGISSDGTVLTMERNTLSRPKPYEKPEQYQVFYRRDTLNPEQMKDIPSQSLFVGIDRSSPAYLYIIGIPDEIALKKIQKTTGDSPLMDFLPWSEFVVTFEEIVQSFVIRDDYKRYDLIPGLISILRTNTEKPIGLTWNSGIAYTIEQYLKAEEYYETYSADRINYNPKEIFSGYHDPKVHFRGLLNW